VIHMGVREPDRIELGALVSDGVEETRRLVAGIDQSCPPRRLIDDEIRILLERADGEGADDHTA
jgi:hypothetical protein